MTRNKSFEAYCKVLRVLPSLSLLACDEVHEGVAHQVATDAGVVQAQEDAAAPKIGAPQENEQLGRDTGCDLTGRWIMTEHQSIDVLGSHQIAINWFYVELTQQESRVAMTTAMSCGRTTIGLPIIEVQIDDSSAWPEYMRQVRYDGRKGSAVETAGNCQISFERAVLVRGATVSIYRDLKKPLPQLEEEARDDTPGWEDWDDDGHPGVTMKVSGTIWGSIYEVSRTWTEYEGLVPKDAGSFTLAQKWQQERVTLGYDESPVLVYEGVRDPDEARHTVELTRLLPEQARGDDAAKCEAIRELAPTLTPNANSRELY